MGLTRDLSACQIVIWQKLVIMIKKYWIIVRKAWFQLKHHKSPFSFSVFFLSNLFILSICFLLLTYSELQLTSPVVVVIW